MNKQLSGFWLAAIVSLLVCSCSGDKGTDPAPKATVMDIDGNEYDTVTIGNQTWMTSNLRVTHYRNGEAIQHITDSVEWQGLSSGAYSDYNNDVGTAAVYGRYYNWYAVGDARNIAPSGWRVASDQDWQELLDYLGGTTVAGGKLKETGTTYWNSPNTGATDEIRMAVRGTGERDQYSGFKGIKSFAVFWTSTEENDASANYRDLEYDATAVYHDQSDKRDGYSIRCVKGD